MDENVYRVNVTLTTVGFGDIAPQTALGQTLASIIMITGYGIIAVPPGIVTYDMTQVMKGGANENETVFTSCNKANMAKTLNFANIAAALCLRNVIRKFLAHISKILFPR